jgi:hypothetical protein
MLLAEGVLDNPRQEGQGVSNIAVNLER